MSEAPAPQFLRQAAPLRHQVVDELRRRIVTNAYPQGSRLVERLLCEELQVSRTVIREALRQLETERLVASTPNVGPVVRTLTRNEVRSLYEVRAALESLAARECAVNATDEQRRRLAEALGEIERVGLADTEQLLAAKDAFATVIVEGSGNEVVGDMLSSIRARVSLLRSRTLKTPGRFRDTVSELREILTSVQRGDSARAEHAARRHAENAARIALDEGT